MASEHQSEAAPTPAAGGRRRSDASPESAERGAQLVSANIIMGHPDKVNVISFNNISNILRYLYEKPPHNNRKRG